MILIDRRFFFILRQFYKASIRQSYACKMATMEGPLSKWTNVVKGWQYRWFVLDDQAGLLSYFTSKDKMKRGSRRGCVRLKGAIIGIDDDDDSTFTITVDHKTFHFQARDADERQRWIEGLENAILRHAHKIKSLAPVTVPSAEDFDRKLAETDAYLQILITQVDALTTRIEACEDVAEKEKYNVIKVTANAMIEAIKHSIVMLQISKETLKEPLLNGSMHEPVLTQGADFDYFSNAHPVEDVSQGDPTPPSISYSSSEDEDFFDAEEDQRSPKVSPNKRLKGVPQADEEKGEDDEAVDEKAMSQSQPVTGSGTTSVVEAPKDDYYDELYDMVEEEGLGSLEKHGSIITHLLSQVRIGMDLTKVVLPTFILERKSLLEMYADFFAHPEIFLQTVDMPTPQERMVQLVRWYMSAFHASRNSDIAKKPYNPILGETFACYWNAPGYEKSEELVTDGPLPWATTNTLSFIAEQVSHHPPISAFYAEHVNKRISLDGYIWTKSKFLGLSIGVHMIGQAVVSLLDWDEEYIITFPNGYGRSILTVPWVELGGTVTVSCAKTGYNASIEFLTKPFYGGKKHRISGNVYAPGDKKPVCTLDGEWNATVWAKHSTGMNEAFVDTKALPITKKQVKPREEQGEFESRRMWQEVTYNLREGNVEKATEYKQRLEQRQRDEAKERKEKGAPIETKFFHEVGEHWVFDRPLLKRLSKASSSSSSTAAAAPPPTGTNTAQSVS